MGGCRIDTASSRPQLQQDWSLSSSSLWSLDPSPEKFRLTHWDTTWWEGEAIRDISYPAELPGKYSHELPQMIPCGTELPSRVQPTPGIKTNNKSLLVTAAKSCSGMSWSNRLLRLGPSEYVVQYIAWSKSPICSAYLDLYFHSIHLSKLWFFRAEFIVTKTKGKFPVLDWCLLVVWSELHSLTSLGFKFFIFKMSILLVPISYGC